MPGRSVTDNIGEENRHSARGVSLTASAQEALVTAWRSLRVNLFRTVLTLLGIIIGVAAVVAMLAVGEGSRQKVLDRISAFGTNLMLIRPGAAGIRNTGDIVTLVPEDAAAIKDTAEYRRRFARAQQPDDGALRQHRLSNVGAGNRRRLPIRSRLAGGRRTVFSSG